MKVKKGAFCFFSLLVAAAVDTAAVDTVEKFWQNLVFSGGKMVKWNREKINLSKPSHK